MGPTCTHRTIARHARIVWLNKTIMAAEMSSIVQKSKKQTCILVEEDGAGPAMPRESVEECSMLQLKRSSTCRGAKNSGEKMLWYTATGRPIKFSKACKFCIRFC